MTAQLINGRDGFNKSDEESYRKALTLFEQALNKDPTLARAWSGIAAVWNYLADVYVRPLEGYPASRDAALKALAIDPRNVQASLLPGGGQSDPALGHERRGCAVP